jgi:hypothetical protein
MLMINPLLFFLKCGSIARVTSMTPKTLTPNCSCTFSRAIPSSTPNVLKPALLINASILPNRAVPDSIVWRMLSRS